ncbi:MAG TPA: capsular biosynthesis protein [Chthoniobacterales bacterium]
MIEGGLWCFEGKRILLLQGPVGPFFQRLSWDLRKAGATVFKLNFNGGDWLFYPTDATPFQGTPEIWPEYFERYLLIKRIELVMLFGDCRPLHRVAHEICLKHRVEVGVFEEGYVRPDFVSFERFGVNDNSLLPRNPRFYLKRKVVRYQLPLKVGNAFWYAVTWAMIYNTASTLLRGAFPHYQHHRTLTVTEGLLWLRSLWRKIYYSSTERGIQEKLLDKQGPRYFLVPLQVHNDAQIQQHSAFEDVEDFIVDVMGSFAKHADPKVVLVFKHHPLDRGCRDYTALITHAAQVLGLEGRVYYIHDQHLPTLIKNALGVVVINSTVGLSSIGHRVPVKTCGQALYNIEGMVYPGSLDEFWKNPVRGDHKLYRKFRNFLVRTTQLNGNFYRRLPLTNSESGIQWM